MESLSSPMPLFQAVALIFALLLGMALLGVGVAWILMKRFPSLRERLTAPKTPAQVWKEAAFFALGLAAINVGLYLAGHLPNPKGAFFTVPLSFIGMVGLGLWQLRQGVGKR